MFTSGFGIRYEHINIVATNFVTFYINFTLKLFKYAKVQLQ